MRCMEFRILGSLEAEAATGERLALGGPSEQKVLAVLLLDAGHVVPLARLVDALWDDDPPATAVKQAQNAVGRVRRVLARSGEPGLIVTESAGYRVLLDGNSLDTRVFEAKVAQAEAAAAAGDGAGAAALLRCALDLWRGPALAGLSGLIIEAASGAWDERRCAVQEACYDHGLAFGDHREIVGELRALVATHPLRERPVAQLMLALYRCGRKAEALDVYQRARTALAGELGLDPGPQLQRLQQQILAGDTDLDQPAAGQRRVHAPSAPARLAVPRQLPAAPRNFTGRSGELKELTGLLDGHSETGSTILITAIGGTAGIGKTALAVHWAHQAAPRFPDGQLYVNLRGFDPSGMPMQPAEAMRGFLAALNVPAERFPATLEQQAALYRSLLADRRMLIVLDNARDTTQVRPLLPGSPGCMAVVTSRNQPTGLVAAEGAYPVGLGLLAEDEALQLLAGRMAAGRLAAEKAAARELISLCAGLPLALSIAAARAATNPGLSLATITAELRDARTRLDALDADDSASARAAFSWSYRQLTGSAARMFRLLGLHPGPDVSLPAAASLAGVCHDEARRALSELTTAHLVNEHVAGRFAFHDLLRSYAAERARADETMTARHDATGRLLDHYLHTAYGAACLLHPARDLIALAAPHPGTTPEDLPGQPKALAWFDAEHRVLLTVVAFASDAGFCRHAWQIPWTLANFLDRRGRWHDWRGVQRIALDAARRDGDTTGQAHAHTLLARAEVRLGLHDECGEHFREALALFQALGDHAACARAHLDLGWLANQEKLYEDSLGPQLRALELYESIGHGAGKAHTLTNLGWTYAILGDHERAIACCLEALSLHRAHHNSVAPAATLDTLGFVHQRLGDYPQALGYYQQAIDQSRKLGAHHRVAATLTKLAETHAASGNQQAAQSAWQQALAILDAIGHPDAADVRAELARIRS